MKTIEELNKEVKEKLDKGELRSFSAMPGDGEMGFVEWIKDTSDGILIKLYGCSYLWKGDPEVGSLEGLGLAKAMFSQLLRDIVMKSFLFSGSIILLFFFARKRFIHYAQKYTSVMYFHTIYKAKRHFGWGYIKQCRPTRELKRAMEVTLTKHINKHIEKNGLKEFNVVEGVKVFSKKPTLEQLHRNNQLSLGLELYEMVADVSEFAYYFIEQDGAYRLRFQDVVVHLNKDNVRKDVAKELRRLLDIMIEREDSEGQKNKWRALKKMTYLLYFWKDMRDLIRDFLLELRVERVKMDEDDRYFALKRKYKYFGRTYEDRVKEREKIDKEKGHVLLNYKKVNVPRRT